MSAIPKTAYWNESQKRLIGFNGLLMDRSLLFTSTRAAIAIETADKTNPTPTRWSWVTPDGWCVILRAKGTKMNSYMGRRIAMKSRGITGIEDAGTSNEPKKRSIRLPCWTEKVWSCAIQVFNMTVLAIMGIILVNTFTSST